jgi:hypothetical protein
MTVQTISNLVLPFWNQAMTTEVEARESQMNDIIGDVTSQYIPKRPGM